MNKKRKGRPHQIRSEWQNERAESLKGEEGSFYATQKQIRIRVAADDRMFAVKIVTFCRLCLFCDNVSSQFSN